MHSVKTKKKQKHQVAYFFCFVFNLLSFVKTKENSPDRVLLGVSLPGDQKQVLLPPYFIYFKYIFNFDINFVRRFHYGGRGEWGNCGARGSVGQRISLDSRSWNLCFREYHSFIFSWSHQGVCSYSLNEFLSQKKQNKTTTLISNCNCRCRVTKR